MANESWIWVMDLFGFASAGTLPFLGYQMTNKRAKCLLINQQTVLLPYTPQDESNLQRDLISRNPARHIHTRCRDG